MRAVWIDAGNNPDPAMCAKHGIDTVLFSANDSGTTKARLDQWRGQFKVGIYAARNWWGLAPTDMAAKVSGLVRVLGGDTNQLAVDLNPEPYDDLYVDSLLSLWRLIRPTRDTRLSIEWNKGALISRATLNAINADPNLIVQEEAFGGDMSPHDPDEARSDLVNYGVRRDRAVPCYDAARLGAKWDGVAFTQGRLK